MQHVIISRERTNDLIDTVLRKMPEAPAGTFIPEEGEQFVPQGNRWLEEQVTAYLSEHTPDSLAQPVPQREMKDYDFHEDVKNASLKIDTGVGYYYNPLRDRSYQGEDQSSKTLNGDHDCWADGRSLEMALNFLRTRYNPRTGKMQFAVKNEVWACTTDCGQLSSHDLESLRSHMSELLNSDDPELIQEVRKTQRLDGGLPTAALVNISAKHASEWLKTKGLTCSELTKKEKDAVAVGVECKHLDDEVTEDNIFDGVKLALQAVEAGSGLSAASKARISDVVTGAMSSILEHRPEKTTMAQWSQVLSEAAYYLGAQIADEQEDKATDEGPDEEDWRYEASAKVVQEGPSFDYQLAGTSMSVDPTITGYIKVFGAAHDPRGDDGGYRRTAEVHSQWIPIEGLSDADEKDLVHSDSRLEDVSVPVDDSAEPGSSNATTQTTQGRRSRRKWLMSKLSLRRH